MAVVEGDEEKTTELCLHKHFGFIASRLSFCVVELLYSGDRGTDRKEQICNGNINRLHGH